MALVQSQGRAAFLDSGTGDFQLCAEGALFSTLEYRVPGPHSTAFVIYGSDVRSTNDMMKWEPDHILKYNGCYWLSLNECEDVTQTHWEGKIFL